MRPDAEVAAETEPHVILRASVEAERVWIDEAALVTVRRAERDHDRRPGRQCDARERRRRRRLARGVLHRRLPPQRLLHRPLELRVVGERRGERRRMAEERVQQVADESEGGLRAGGQEEAVPILIVTHEATYAEMTAAVAELDALPVVKKGSFLARMIPGPASA